jgi:hypothetical protein
MGPRSSRVSPYRCANRRSVTSTGARLRARQDIHARSGRSPNSVQGFGIDLGDAEGAGRDAHGYTREVAVNGGLRAASCATWPVCGRKRSSVGQRPLNKSERLTPRASAIRLTVGIVGECHPRSISPRYLPSIRGMRLATWSSFSPRSLRVARIASPSWRERGSARVRRGKDHRTLGGHVPASLCLRDAVEHSTCSPL